MLLEMKIENHDKEIETLFTAIRSLVEPPPPTSKRPIGFQVEDRKAVYKTRKNLS